MRTSPHGKYGSFAELERHETADRDYRVRILERTDAPILVVAPHGGMIEAGTSQLAEAIAGDDLHLFSFEGLKSHGENRALHITSHRFDHPTCVALASKSALVISIHGCLGESRIHIGGLDGEITGCLAAELTAAGFNTEWPSTRYPGRHPNNICNRGFSGKGAQLEFTSDLRTGNVDTLIARAVRDVLASWNRNKVRAVNQLVSG